MAPAMSPPDQPAIVAAFLGRYHDDLESGTRRTLADYQAMFPGHDEVIARELDELESAAGPERIAHYELVREVGRGGQGRVFLAHDPRLGRDIALKILPDHGPLSAQALARFRREAEVAARLDHPGIATVLDTGQSDGVVYIAMRFIDGETLSARNRRLRATPAEIESRDHVFSTVRLFERIARAVHAAHEAGIVHRDLKPGNVIVTRTGDPVVLDFGLARAETGGEALTHTGEVFGTPVYMSPEQLRGLPLDRRTDVYSLGAALYECLTLQLPISAPTREALYQAILETRPTDPKRHVRTIPRELCAVLEIALDKDRERRYSSAEDLAEDLRRIANYEPIRARPPGRSVRALRWVQRNRLIATLATLLFVVLTTALGVTWSLLEESRAALDDIRAGRASKREQRLEELLLRAHQAAYSADPRPAAGHLDEALALDPGNIDAIALRVWLTLDRPETALQTLDELAARGGLADHADVAWLRAFVLDALGDGEAARTERARAGVERNALRLYFEGLRAVGGFVGSVDATAYRRGIELFRAAAMRADRPRFHHHHSIMMAAARLGDRELLERAGADLEFHWTDEAATHEAVAQFFMPVDRARAVRSLERLTELTPRAAAPWCGLGFAAIASGDRQRAMRCFDRGIEVDPTFAATWQMRGELRLELGDRERGGLDLAEARRLRATQ